MGLSFLTPLFLAAAALVAIPILVHLRRRSERREVPFPSLMFLRDVPVRSERRRTLRHLLLLALRAAALILLVAAFARPFLSGDEARAAATLGPREVVLAVDRSWSMAAPGRWDAAVDAVRRETADLGPRDRASLVLFDGSAEAAVRSTPDASRVLRGVEAARPGDGGTRFAPALRLSGSLLETSTLQRKEIVLVSDFPDEAWAPDDDLRLPPGATLRTVPIEVPTPADLSVLSADARAQGVGPGAGVRVRARAMLRSGGARDADVVLEVEEREEERHRVSLEPGVPAEVTFEAVPVGSDPLRATVRIEGVGAGGARDGLPADDVFRLVLTGGRAVSVLVLEPGGSGEPSLYLRRALEAGADPPVRVTVRSGAGLDEAALEGHHVVILNDRPLPRGAGGRALRAFVEDGGGLLLAAGPDAPGAESDRDFLPALPGPPVDPAREAGGRLATVARGHPVFEPFREAGSGNLSAARFFRMRRLEPGDSARVLARFDDGAPALVEGTAGRGRILVWASTLHTFWTDLPLQPVYVPLVHRAVTHLASLSSAPASYEVGDVLAPEDRDPGSEAADGSPLVLREAGFRRPGGDGDGGGVLVAVNAPRTEGLGGGLDPQVLAAAVSPAPGDQAATDPAPPGPEDRERSQGLWRMLILGAFLVLVAETPLSNRLSRAHGSGGAS